MSEIVSRGPGFGAFVISLDFELVWGIRDVVHRQTDYRARLLAARRAIPAILDLFEEFQVAATWATVGFLFAASRTDLSEFLPALRPVYSDQRLDPYSETIGPDEEEDPFHFGASLVQKIRAFQNQEIATHTMSHYYALQDGHNEIAFREDLRSALRIARSRGIMISSFVFPRNQCNPAYFPILAEAGITAYRGNARGWIHHVDRKKSLKVVGRGARLLDSYVPLSKSDSYPWSEVVQRAGLCNVRASRFLRPCGNLFQRLDSVRLNVILRSLREASERRTIYHLWWHPENFGGDVTRNCRRLERILRWYRQMHVQFGLQSMTMAQVAKTARELAS